MRLAYWLNRACCEIDLNLKANDAAKIKARGEAAIAGLMRAVTRVLIREVDF